MFDNQPLICQNCNRSFPQEQTLNEHPATDHQARVRFKCKHCIKTLTKEDDLEGHVEKFIYKFQRKIRMNVRIRNVKTYFHQMY